MKRLLAVWLVLMMMISAFPAKASQISSESGKIDLGKVIEVVDGEVLKVFFYRRGLEMPVVELVKVVGIDTDASGEAFAYATNRLLGQTVYFLYEEDLEPTMDGMVDAHVFVDYDMTYAEELLSLGYGKVDAVYKDVEFYHDLIKAQYSAQLYEIGIWETSTSRNTDRININTASKNVIKSNLNVTEDQATEIVAYRDRNAFNDIFEIMAADYSLDSEWFDENSHLMSVVTNVNVASYLELSSLFGDGISFDPVLEDLDYYLKFNEVTDLDQLHEVDSFSGYLSLLKPYLTIEADNVLEEPELKAVNINTVSKEDFTLVTGLSAFDYDKLQKLKKDDYIITSLAELYRLTDILTKQRAYGYTHRLRTLTDINNAGAFELKTLLTVDEDLTLLQKQDLADAIIASRPYYSKDEVRIVLGNTLYSLIEPYIFIYEEDIPDRYNPYTAEENDVDYLDAKYNGQMTRITNINRASREVLLDLHEDMTVKLVDEIMEYRSRYPFRDNDDLYDLFIKHDRKALYNSIAYYLAYE